MQNSLTFAKRFCNSANMHWDDLKYVLALHRAGSLVRAGKLLHVNTSTVGRRIMALEQSLDAKLFDRIGGGYKSTSAALRVVACAEEMELQATAMQRQLKGLDSRVEGPVRITALDNFLDAIVLPALPDFLEQHPGLEITLESDLRLFMLTEGEADIAVRTIKPDQPELVARLLGPLPSGFYQLRGKEWTGPLPLIGLPDRPEYDAYNKDLVAKVPGGRIVARANTEARITELVKRGLGIGLVDCFVGDIEPELELIPGFGVSQAEAWAIAHVDMRRSPRVLATLDFLKDATSRVSNLNKR